MNIAVPPTDERYAHAAAEVVAYWQNHVDAWRASGLSQRAYATIHRISKSTFHRKCDELQPASTYGFPQPFTPAETRPAQPTGKITVDGVTVSFTEDADHELARRVLNALLES